MSFFTQKNTYLVREMQYKDELLNEAFLDLKQLEYFS